MGWKNVRKRGRRQKIQHSNFLNYFHQILQLQINKGLSGLRPEHPQKFTLLVLENHNFYKDDSLKRISPPIKTSKCFHSYGICLDINNLSISIRIKMTTQRGKKYFLNGPIVQQLMSHTSNVQVKELGADKLQNFLKQGKLRVEGKREQLRA